MWTLVMSWKWGVGGQVSKIVTCASEDVVARTCSGSGLLLEISLGTALLESRVADNSYSLTQ